jgi:hypothetical protein
MAYEDVDKLTACPQCGSLQYWFGGEEWRCWCRPLAGSIELAARFLEGISPVAWRNVNLIGNFDFTTSSSLVDIEAMAERYRNEDFWRRSMTEGDGDGPQE